MTDQIKINDRVQGTYHGQSFTGVVTGFSYSKFGPFVMIDLEQPITVFCGERRQIGFHWDRENDRETMTLLESREPVECEYIQGHVFGRCG